MTTRETAPDLQVRVLEGLKGIPADAWDALLCPEDTPFVRYDWLESLEAAGCVTPEVGWLPQHITLWQGERLVAAMPVYVKGSLEGEFIFDHAWENAAARMGISYYPKLISAVPFTPSTGARLLVPSGEGRELYAPLLAEALRTLTGHLELSGAHVLFPNPRDLATLEAAGYVHRLGIQYHWHNRGYTSYEDFLGSFNARRRHQLRRERREVQQSGIMTRTHRGTEITDEVLEAMYRFYLRTVERFFPWTRQYLNRSFFERVIERMPEAIEIVLASEGGTPIAGAFNVSGGGRLYGRYWGTEVERPFLHFHVCYYHSIEECIERGIQIFEPGAGGEHKRPRGFEPTLTHSAHLLTHRRLDQAVRQHLELERAAVRRAVEGKED